MYVISGSDSRCTVLIADVLKEVMLSCKSIIYVQFHILALHLFSTYLICFFIPESPYTTDCCPICSINPLLFAVTKDLILPSCI